MHGSVAVRPNVLFGTTVECRDSPGNLGYLRRHEMRCTTSPRATAFKRIYREVLGPPIKVSPGVPVPECLIFGTFGHDVLVVPWFPRACQLPDRCLEPGCARCTVVSPGVPVTGSLFELGVLVERFPRACLYRIASSMR